MQTTQQNAPLKRTMKTRHLIMLSLGGGLAQDYSSIPVHHFHHWSGGNAAGLSDWCAGGLAGYAVSGRAVGRDAGDRSVSRLCPRYLGPATGYTVASALLADPTVALG